MKKIILLISIGAGFSCDSVSANSTNQKRYSKEQIGKAVVYGLSGIAFSALAAVKGYDLYKMVRHYIMHQHTLEILIMHQHVLERPVFYDRNYTVWPLAKELALGLTCVAGSMGSFTCMIKELRQK